MELYAGIDLHSNNSVVVVLDEQDRTVYAKRLPNDLGAIAAALRSCAGTLRGVAVESTYNWYWLVDGLQAAGFILHLVNTTAVKQYDGLKHAGDFSDARHLAHLLRLGILPVGYIYPREERAVRDLLRKRSQLVRQRSSQILSIENLIARNLGARATGNQVKGFEPENIDAMDLLDEQKQALKANLAVMKCIDQQVDQLDVAIDLDRQRLITPSPARTRTSGSRVAISTGRQQRPMGHSMSMVKSMVKSSRNTRLSRRPSKRWWPRGLHTTRVPHPHS